MGHSFTLICHQRIHIDPELQGYWFFFRKPTVDMSGALQGKKWEFDDPHGFLPAQAIP